VVRSSQTCHNNIVIISNTEAFPLNALTLLVGSQEKHPHIVVQSSQTCHNDIVIISNIEAFPLNALMLLVGSQEGHPARKKTEWWGAGMVICLERGADLHMAQLTPLPLTVSYASVKSRLVLPFWYRLTWVVPDKVPIDQKS